MKKIINNIFYVAFIIFACTSCDLTLIPENSVSPETYFKTETDLELWSNQFYTMLDNADDATGRDADDLIDRNLSDFIAGTRSAAIESGWSWGQLRKINQMLDNIDKCTDNEARTEYEGVARFFRAYFYFVKVRRYGDVPWYDKMINSTDEEMLKKARDDRGFVMDKIMEDFNVAINNLSSKKNVSRVTKWTALAYKSRIALFEGTFRKYHGMPDAEKYLTQAQDAALTFIKNSGYSIYNEGSEPYRDLFRSDNAKEQEVVLARLYNFADLKLSHSIQQAIINLSQGLTRRFMNHYLMSDGTYFSSKTGYETMSFTEETKNRDPRMAQTVLCPGYVQTGATKVTTNKLNACTGYQPIKYVASTEHDGASKGTSDFPLMRAAEVMLNYAEAKAELGTITQADLDMSVNEIRKRVNLPALNLEKANNNPDALLEEYYPNVTKSNNTGVILEIRRERTVELVMEGNRAFDMFRWKEGANLVNEKHPYYGIYFPGAGVYDMDNDGVNDMELYTTAPTSNVATKKMIGSDIVLSEGDNGYIVAFSTVLCKWNEDRDYLWPIPADQRVLTGGILTQNPNWDDGLQL